MTTGRKVTQLTLDRVIYIIEIIRQNYTQMHSIFLQNLKIFLMSREKTKKNTILSFTAIKKIGHNKNIKQKITAKSVEIRL